MKKVILGVVLVIFPALVLFGQHGHSTNHNGNTSLTDGLGDIHHQVSTTNPEAQKFYNQLVNARKIFYLSFLTVVYGFKTL